jgi:hypothetical protein
MIFKSTSTAASTPPSEDSEAPADGPATAEADEDGAYLNIPPPP